MTSSCACRLVKSGFLLSDLTDGEQGILCIALKSESESRYQPLLSKASYLRVNVAWAKQKIIISNS